MEKFKNAPVGFFLLFINIPTDTTIGTAASIARQALSRLNDSTKVVGWPRIYKNVE